jgi:hypothetical protein
MEVSGQLHAPAILSLGRSPRYPLKRRLSGPQSRSELSGEEEFHHCSSSFRRDATSITLFLSYHNTARRHILEELDLNLHRREDTNLLIPWRSSEPRNLLLTRFRTAFVWKVASSLKWMLGISLLASTFSNMSAIKSSRSGSSCGWMLCRVSSMYT